MTVRSFLAFTVLLAAPVSAQTTIETTSFWDGLMQVQPFGKPNTATYGQTFVAPSSDNVLNSFSFFLRDLGGGPDLQFQGYVAAFDPTIGALVTTYGLHEGGRVPTEAEIAQALERTSWRLLQIDPGASTVHCKQAGLELDLGGYGKGLALDEAARVLRARGVESALLNFGGQVLALGCPPGEPGWVVELAHPADRTRPVAELRLRDASISTSSNRERSHVLDPRTGRSATWNATVTVIAPRGEAADALSTALLVAGPEHGPKLLPRNAEYLALDDRDGENLARAGSPGLLARLTWK